MQNTPEKQVYLLADRSGMLYDSKRLQNTRKCTTMTTKMVFHGSDIEKICDYYHLNKEDIVKFGANVNPLGLSASVKKEIAENIRALTSKTYGSFVVDRLDYLRAGGRCSTIAMLGANLLSLKPSIIVNNKDGSMTVGKKYRGKLEKVLPQYIDDKLAEFDNINPKRVFITHSGISDERLKLVYDYLKSKNVFNEILISRAGCTISSHCGPNTLGILFMTK